MRSVVYQCYLLKIVKIKKVLYKLGVLQEAIKYGKYEILEVLFVQEFEGRERIFKNFEIIAAVAKLLMHARGGTPAPSRPA